MDQSVRKHGSRSLPGGQEREPNAEGRPVVFLLPGHVHATGDPSQMVTILGSCVSVCLWESRLRIGGMNHFLLPNRGGDGPNLRFAGHSVPELLRRMLALGAERKHITAKVFGGAALHRSEEEYSGSLGAKNVQAALRLLAADGIPVVAQETGGRRGRKIIFRSDEGVAWSKTV